MDGRPVFDYRVGRATLGSVPEAALVDVGRAGATQDGSAPVRLSEV